MTSKNTRLYQYQIISSKLLHYLWLWLSPSMITVQYIIYCGFVDGIMFSFTVVGHWWCMVRLMGRVKDVSQQETFREGRSSSASALPLFVLLPVDWHTSSVCLTIHNRVGLWKQTVPCSCGRKSAVLDCIVWNCIIWPVTVHQQVIFVQIEVVSQNYERTMRLKYFLQVYAVLCGIF